MGSGDVAECSSSKRKRSEVDNFSSALDSFWSGFDDWVSSSQRDPDNVGQCQDVDVSLDSPVQAQCLEAVPDGYVEDEYFGGDCGDGSCSSLPFSGRSFRSDDMIRLCRADTRELLEFEGPSSNCVHCGAIFWYGERLDKRSQTSSPRFYLCCGHGKVSLPYLKDSPRLLDELMDYNGGRRSKNFRNNIRPCNCMYNFTSFGVNIDTNVTNRPGPFCYRIYGETYHCIGSLLPVDGGAPKFAQLYVVDTENEVKNRLAAVNNENLSDPVDEELVEDLKNMFDTENKLVRIFRKARDAFIENPDVALELKLIAPFMADGSQYAHAQCPEVVGLIVGEEDDLAVGFEIVVKTVEGGLKKVDMLHPSYMPLQYPILFPFGEDGYHVGLKLNPGSSRAQSESASRKKRVRMSPAEYYRFRLQQRLFETTRILRGGKLFHQFVVDAYTCVEQNRLKFHRYNQDCLRSELYQGLADAFARGDNDVSALGKRIVLPSSFTGGPRYMQQNYQDAMAICRACGNPDLFVTFTCNANWKEYENALRLIPGQKIQDRPDLIARVFKLKLDALLKYFKEQRYFGKVDAVVYTIEFQKRGLPHAHIVLWLDAHTKPKTPEEIDRLISAKIPDPDVDLQGYLACKSFMMHGPCGLDNPRCPCMVNGQCTKKFPKDFCDATYVDDEGFPIYKRPNDGITVNKNRVLLDNREIKVGTCYQKDFPKTFVWNKKRCAWTERKKGRTIGRMYYAHPASGDRFYLRMLLNIVKGCTCYEDIRTFNGRVYDTFREACQARGLIGEDDEWREALNEAYRWANGFQMRDLFCMILIHCDVVSPLQLWNDTWHLLSDDIVHNRRQYLCNPTAEIPVTDLQDMILVQLDLILRRNNTTLRKCGLPRPISRVGDYSARGPLNEELRYDRAEQAEEHCSLYSTLNVDQMNAYQQIIESVEQQVGKLFFVYGQGGTGKTHLWKTLLSKLRSEGKPAIAVASSGIAALLLPGGRTAHSRFKIPFECQHNSTCSITPKSKLAELIREAKLIIWDEAPMDHRFCFEAVDRTFRDIMSLVNSDAKDMVFGGKTVVLGGDFRQVLPVVEQGSRIETVQSSIVRSKLWKSCHLLYLTKNMRLNDVGLTVQQKEELEEFAQWLLDVGDGNAPNVSISDHHQSEYISIPKELLLPPEKVC